jgi:hypothetical protein
MKVHRPSGAAMRPSSRGVMFGAGGWLGLLLCLGLFVARPVGADPEELSGWWRIVDRVESSDYAAYRGLRIEYLVRLRQEGAWILGEGHKFAERDLVLPASRRTPIAIAGTISGSSVTVSLVEHGHRRESSGDFSWTLDDARGRMVGTFRSEAAASRGSSVAERLPVP